MAYDPRLYFPQAYQPYPMYQQPQQLQQQPQQMTLPTIHAEIVQVDNEEAAANYPVGAGMSQMMISKDDSMIFVKTAGQNGVTLDVYEKRPPAPAATPFDPAAYVTKDELENRLAAILAAKEGNHGTV